MAFAGYDRKDLPSKDTPVRLVTFHEWPRGLAKSIPISPTLSQIVDPDMSG